MSVELVVSLKKDLKGNIIFPRGFLREVLRANAGQTIILNYYEKQIRCRVNNQGCLLVNSQLKELLKELDTDSFMLQPDIFQPGGAGIFTLMPQRKHKQQGGRQLDSLPSVIFADPTPVPRADKSNKAAATPKQDKSAVVKDQANLSEKSSLRSPVKPPDIPFAKISVSHPHAVPLQKPVRIQFSAATDERILAAAEKGEADPPADLLLHRDALLLSLNPGFDTLLSLSAVRNVEPLDYQLATVRHVLKNLRGRALLCDEVGLGKTIEAGLIMMEYLLRGLAQRVLVLTPPSLVEQWQEEMQMKFNINFITYDHPDFKSHPRPWEHFERVIASLDTAKHKQNKEQVLGAEYDLVIVDEAHHLKNHRTLAYQMVQQLKKKYILLLTATPVENNLDELFNLITLLLPGQLETATSFKRKYITRGDPLKPKNTEDLKKLVREVMVRNRRSETGVIQVRRRAEVVEVALAPEELDFYRRLTAFVRFRYANKSGSFGDGVNQFMLKLLQREAGSSPEAVLSTLEKLAAGQKQQPGEQQELSSLIDCARQISRCAKAEALLKLLRRIPEKVIVFTGFRETQRRLVTFLREEGIEVAELHGGMRRLQKEEQVKLFAEKGQVMLSTDIGSEGRNLQFCQYIVNYDLPWNPMRIEQRIGRLHRLGQKKDVFILNFAAKQTVEAYVLDLLDAKINMFQLVVGELDMILGSLKEKKDFESIIMDIWSGAESEEKLSYDMGKLGERLVEAKKQYEAVRQLDDRLLGELLPLEE
ncbi:MAG: SNF2-related protein [Bacillota bacterium]|nr:SNF2-related protein [Bacillota bacterium]